MVKKDLKKYCDLAFENGAADVKIIEPSRVETAPWVRQKCEFGCPGFGHSYTCPPHTPDDEKTRRVLDAYQRAMLFHIRTARPTGKAMGKKFLNSMIDLEGVMFKDGYYKAFVYLAGPCAICSECGKAEDSGCRNRYRARPSMESCGIDVFATARNNGFHIKTLREVGEPRDLFCLMLVD